MAKDNLARAVSASQPGGLELTATPDSVKVGEMIRLEAHIESPASYTYVFEFAGHKQTSDSAEIFVTTTGLTPSSYQAAVTATAKSSGGGPAANPHTATTNVIVNPKEFGPGDEVAVKPSGGTFPLSLPGPVGVSLQRTALLPSSDQVLWPIIRNRTRSIAFPAYKRFMDGVMCTRAKDGFVHSGGMSIPTERSLPFPFVEPYNLLKTATEYFLMTECGVASLKEGIFTNLADETERMGRPVTGADLIKLRDAYLEELVKDGPHVILPYLNVIRQKLSDVPLKSRDELTEANCYGILRSKLTDPCLLELIWSYWHEEGMLVQTMNAISLRFQNKRTVTGRDPLAGLDIDPLRPLNNLLWGYIQDEQHTLSIVRRAYEYDHEYGMTLYGKAVPELRSADSRSQFVEAFHNLLHMAYLFLKESDDTTVIPDGFPVLNALRDVHLILAQGAHNQYGDLPSTARVEMLIQQWLLARPEIREFLGGRIMVPYPEPWMDRVDTMKTLQGWSDVTVTHFHDLGTFGEQLLLSVRYGNWITVFDQLLAANWARYWRPEIQGYIHSYRALTGVDLRVEGMTEAERIARVQKPSELLRQRISTQQARAR